MPEPARVRAASAIRWLGDLPRLEIAERRRDNNLNFMRLCLATGVVFSHCFVLLDRFVDEPMQRWFAFYDLGGIAVLCFFFLSGYLIFKSALRTSPEQFGAARVLRLFPALCVATLICILVLGPAVTTLRIGDYFVQPATWRYLGTAVLQLGTMQLPGVFVGGTVNQPLWTLSAEWLMYMAMLLVCFVATARAGRLTTAGWIVTGGMLLFTATLLPVLPWGHVGHWMLFAACGAAAYSFRSWIPLSVPIMLALLTLDAAALLTIKPLGKALFLPIVAYSLLVIGFHPALQMRWPHRIGDYSYGVYILAWPFQQLMKPYAATPELLFFYSYPLALAAAVLSWHFVEAPSLRLKPGKPMPLEPRLHGSESHVL